MTFTPSSNNVASDIFDLEVPSMDFLSVSKPEETLHKGEKLILNIVDLDKTSKQQDVL